MSTTIIRNLKIYECCVIEFDAAEKNVLPLHFKHYDNAYSLDGENFNDKLLTFSKDVLSGNIMLHPDCDFFEEFESARALAEGLRSTFGISIYNDLSFGINGIGTINEAVARYVIVPKLNRISPKKGYMMKLIQIARSISDAYDTIFDERTANNWIRSKACCRSNVFPELTLFWLGNGAIAIGPTTELYLPDNLGNMNNSSGQALIIEDGEDIVSYLAYGNIEITASVKEKTDKVLRTLARRGYKIRLLPYIDCDLKALGLEVA